MFDVFNEVISYLSESPVYIILFAVSLGMNVLVRFVINRKLSNKRNEPAEEDEAEQELDEIFKNSIMEFKELNFDNPYKITAVDSGKKLCIAYTWEGERRSVLMTKETFLIGTSFNCDLKLPDGSKLKPEHARIKREEDVFQIISETKLSVNGKRRKGKIPITIESEDNFKILNIEFDVIIGN